MDTVESYLLYVKKFYSPIIILPFTLALSLVMLARAVAFSLATVIFSSSVLKDKRRAYFSVARSLLDKIIRKKRAIPT